MPPETTSAGATPVVGAATTSQSSSATTPTTSDSSSDQSATDDAALGDAGKRAIDRMKVERDEAHSRAKAAEAAAKAAEKERDELKLATASDAEKAIAAAKAEGKTEILERLHLSVRRTAVREALLTAGAIPSLVSDLSKADEFAALKVNDDDEIDAKELNEAVKAHKARVKDAYKAPGDAGDADGGSRGGGKPPAGDLTTALERHYAPTQG